MATAHVRRVQRLYRQILKNVNDWAVDRGVFYQEAETIRGLFEQNRVVADSATAEALVNRAEKLLQDRIHPDPYIVPYRPGGSLYQRNPPFPPGMHQVFDFGKENYDN